MWSLWMKRHCRRASPAKFASDDLSGGILLTAVWLAALCLQWALIHVEDQWAENFRTMDGQLFHQKAHDTGFAETRGDRVVKRGIRVYSAALGVSGACDVVEFSRQENGIPLAGHPGLWQPYPVEYKRGKPGVTHGDALQLCGQALCLEEMLCCTIPAGAVYYGELRRREQVVFTEELRAEVRAALTEMHQYAQRGYTPKVKPRKGCGACSLQDVCLPKLMGKPSVEHYVKEAVEG